MAARLPPADPFEHLRRAALAGLAPRPAGHARPRSRESRVPEIPPGATRELREELSMVLREEAARWWRRSTHAWVPTLPAVIARSPARVEVRDRDLVVTLRNAVFRATAMPRPWVPVVVAALTGRELPAVRLRLASGGTIFETEGPCPNP